MRIEARNSRRKTPASGRPSSGALRCRRKFLRFFPQGFRDADYLETERDYKWESHLRWCEALDVGEFSALLRAGRHDEIAARAVRVEQRSLYSMLFSFEKMALRDAIRAPHGAHAFAEGLFQYLHGEGELQTRFESWVDTVARLPRKQTRVLTWPLVTVFGFIAQPEQHIFMKPNTMRAAARAYGFDLEYRSRPNWNTYSKLLELAARVRKEQRDLRPRDLIDIQSFLWVQGSTEYEE
ncbi:MAG TPA: hypothetical protein VJT80_05195 [Steroidobacteraceae bacterium]|nr:hypothetical protein [Steroidobacteraceae bacterium]